MLTAHLRQRGALVALIGTSMFAHRARSDHRLRSADLIERSTHPAALTDRAEPDSAPPVVVLESCHSTWIFEEENHRFRRFVKGVKLERSVSTDWRTYDHLILDDRSDAFIVFLDVAGSRLLRSRRHGAQCDDCNRGSTAELSLVELHALEAS